MRFFFFHLMPYADLDPDYDREHRSAWVTLPNGLYDPVRGADLYDRYLDELEYAAELGFEGVGVNEHHQNAYGLMPCPSVFAGALARRIPATTRIAILGRALPLLSNPLVAAEEFAVLDVITRGRIIAGFVRGIGAEYHSFGVNPTESHDRFQEAHDLIVQAWTRPGPFAFEGRYYDLLHVNPWPRPYQSPHPPIWIPSQGSRETIEFAAHPDRRYVYLQTATPAEQLFRTMQAYRDEARRQGYEASPDQLGWSVKLYVAETDEIARREAKPHIEAFANKFLRMPQEMLLPPGYTSIGSMKALMQAKRTITGGHRTMEQMIEQGTFLCGSPQTVIDQLADYQRRGGFNIVMAGLHFGTLPHELTRKTLEIFAREVMPALKEARPPAALAQAAGAG